MNKKWLIKETDNTAEKKLIHELGLHRLVARLLVNRDIKNKTEAKRFLDCRLDDLYDPFKFKGMKKAVSRIHRALKNKEKILIYGDYDVDGVTSVVLLYTVFNKLNPNISYYIPNRLEEGYDLNVEACDYARDNGIDLIITVDCGITAASEVNYLNRLGIDIIITDHHQPPNELPSALSIIDPLIPGCKYPFKYLAGVGVAFKLAQAVLDDFVGDAFSYLLPHLDLVALGTISDIVPVLDENRILIKHGLKQINHSKKIGLQALIRDTGLDKKDITASHVGFILGPRINAAGRLGSADAPVKLLMTKKEEEAQALAKLLSDGNRARQRVQDKTYKEALMLAERDVNFKEQRVIVLHSDWHPGVVGIVASKMVDKFYRPTIIISSKDKMAKGSGRSIDNFHLLEAVKECADVLDNYGGHSKACGITIEKENISEFSKLINSFAGKVLTAEDLFPSISLDAQIPLSDIDMKFLGQLEELAPFGIGNPKPLFSSKDLVLKDEVRYLRKNGVKLLVSDGTTTCEAVGFSLEDIDFDNLAGKKFSLAYTPSINTYQGRDYITLNIKDLKVD